MSETNKGVNWDARFSPMGSLKIIPLSPQAKLLPQLAAGFLFHSWTNKACLNEDRYEIKILMSETKKGVIWDAGFSPMGSLKIIPLSPQQLNKFRPPDGGESMIPDVIDLYHLETSS